MTLDLPFRPSFLVGIVAGLALCGCSSNSTSAKTSPDASSVSDTSGVSDVSASDTSHPTSDSALPGADTSLPGTDSSGTTDTPVGPAGDSGPVTGSMISPASWFPSTIYFNLAVDSAPLDSQSATIISNWVSNGGFGLGHMQVDTSIDVYYANSGSELIPFDASSAPDTDDDIPTAVPVNPSNTAGFESSTGKTCDGGDCHFLAMDTANRRLIEIYQAQTDGTTFTSDGGSVAIWSFDKAYTAGLRGDVCTSADASGGMMAPVLFTADEVAAGHIDHAIRFILPNTRIQFQEYVRPATHGTGGKTGWATSGGVPYGARFRLKSTFDTSGLTAGAKVVAAALQKYGMILSDGGNVALTAQSDTYSTAKWADVLGSHDLEALTPTDFEMVQMDYGTDHVSSSQRFDFSSYTCVRLP